MEYMDDRDICTSLVKNEVQKEPIFDNQDSPQIYM